MNMKKRLILLLGGAAILMAEWLLVRFPLFGLHGMIGWPFDLFLVGLIAVIIAGALGAKWTVLGTLAGYLIGFFCGEIFDISSSDGYHTQGPSIWACVFLAGILLGIAASVIIPLVTKRRAVN